MLKWLGLGRKLSPDSERTFDRIMAQSRAPALYEDFGVPDTVDGRLEMVMLHMFAVLHRLQDETAEAAGGQPAQAATDDFARDLVETMFSRLDDAMREMGIGDQSVPKKMKLVASAFYGRLRAYSQVCGDREALAQALQRNVGDDQTADGRIADDPLSQRPAEAAAIADFDAPALAAYLQDLLTSLADQPRDSIIAGGLDFTLTRGSASISCNEPEKRP